MLIRLFLWLVMMVPLNAFAIIGEENALLFQLVTTTAQELNELERLVTNAEKYTRKIREYNELMEEHYFRAERVKYLAEDLMAKRKIENLSDFNVALRDLRYSMEDLQYLIKEYQKILAEDEKVGRIVEIKKGLLKKKEMRAKQQVEKSINAGNSGRANQITAQNTALIYEGQVEMQETQLEMLKKVSTTNSILAREQEEKKKYEVDRAKRYGLEEGGR